jgi:hypothetical protein
MRALYHALVDVLPGGIRRDTAFVELHKFGCTLDQFDTFVSALTQVGAVTERDGHLYADKDRGEELGL